MVHFHIEPTVSHDNNFTAYCWAHVVNCNINIFQGLFLRILLFTVYYKQLFYFLGHNSMSSVKS